MDEILTIQEVARRLKLAERTVYAMAADRELPAFKVRGQWRIRAADFKRWLVQVAGDQVEAGRVTMLDNEPPRSELDAVTEAESGSPALLTELRSQEEIHRHFVECLGTQVVWHSLLASKPLELDLKPPLPVRVRVYLYNATRPPGGRPLGEHKIQLIVPGQQRDERGNFDQSDGRIAMVVGYAAEEDVFILWDTGLYSDFAWSRNVQVKVPTIVAAVAGKLATQERRLRLQGASAIETVVAAHASKLGEAIRRRVQLSRERMARD